MKRFAPFLLLATPIAFSSFGALASEINEPPLMIRLKPDLTWGKNHDLSYNNVLGLDSTSHVHDSAYKPVISVIDNMKEHSRHIRSIITEICPQTKIEEVINTNSPERIIEAGLNPAVDILNLSFGQKMFDYKCIFDICVKTLNNLVPQCTGGSEKEAVREYLDGAIDKLLESQIAYLSTEQSGYMPLLKDHLSPEQFMKEIYAHLCDTLKVPTKHTIALEKVINLLDAYEFLPYLKPGCPFYEAILKAAKDGKIIVKSFGNDHNTISLDLEKEYANRICALAKKINESPDIKGRLIIAGNSQYYRNMEFLNPTSTRSTVKQPYVVTAPGTDITAFVTDTKQATYTGTSMAAPAVGGVIAKLLSEYKGKYEEAGITVAASIRCMIADHVIKETRKTNFFTQMPLPDEFGQGVVNYGLAKKAIEEDLQYLQYEKILKQKYEAKVFLGLLGQELEDREERRELAESAYSSRMKHLEGKYKQSILKHYANLVKIKAELENIYTQLDQI